MRWEKKGLIFAVTGQRPWMTTHASLPVSLHLGSSRYRIYFAARDDANRSRVGYVELDLSRPHEVLELASDCVLDIGPLGHFDDHGVYASSIVAAEGRLYMFYVGWNPGPRRPLFYSSIGVAVATDGGRRFEKVSVAPVMARSEWDPCLVTSPCVLIDSGRWRMWYVSGFAWEEVCGALRSRYHIKYAESADGLRWQRHGHVCIELRPGERNVARPCVVKEAGGYRMWYSYDAGEGYRIGYAESADGCSWTRMDDLAGIAPSPTGWDSEALAYPWVFAHRGVRHMLYNGNAYGRDGFGLAQEAAEGGSGVA